MDRGPRRDFCPLQHPCSDQGLLRQTADVATRGASTMVGVGRYGARADSSSLIELGGNRLAAPPAQSSPPPRPEPELVNEQSGKTVGQSGAQPDAIRVPCLGLRAPAGARATYRAARPERHA
jgi:hypothetical protein